MKNEITHTSFKNLLADFKLSNKVSGYAGDSRLYTTPVKELLVWMEEKGVAKITYLETHPQLILDYYEHLIVRPSKRGGTLCNNTVINHLFALRLFQDFLQENNHLKKVILMPSHARPDYVGRDPWSLEQIKVMYGACKNDYETAVLNLAYGCGLRRCELYRLQVSDINFGKGFLIVRKGKRNKRREIPLSDKICEQLKKYVGGERHIRLQKGDINEPYFFVNTCGKHSVGDTIKKNFDTIRIRSGIDQYGTLHDLRASITHHLLDNGADINFVKDFLGHVRIDTTHLYAMKRKLYAKLLNVA